MKSYVLRRLWQSALTLAGVSVLVFVILRVLPGDPAKMLLPEGAPQSAIDELNRQLGLHEPLYVQYGLFVKSVFQGDFGQSFQYRAPALRVVVERLGATVQLALAAMFQGQTKERLNNPEMTAAVGNFMSQANRLIG